jgi:hypothetical protein
MMDRAQRNRLQYGGMRGGEKDIDDVIPVVEFSSNMSKELKDYCIKIAKETMSKHKNINDSRNCNRK